MVLDMDLCCLLDLGSDTPPSASQFVLRAAQLLEKETKFAVKPLPNARLYPFVQKCPVRQSLTLVQVFLSSNSPFNHRLAYRLESLVILDLRIVSLWRILGSYSLMPPLTQRESEPLSCSVSLLLLSIQYYTEPNSKIVEQAQVRSYLASAEALFLTHPSGKSTAPTMGHFQAMDMFYL